MRRNSRLVAYAGIALSAILLVAGGLLLWGIAFALGGLTLLASLFGLTLSHRPEITHEAIPTTGHDVKTA